MQTLKLTDDEIAFLRYTCNIFFLPESPLYAFEAEKREPKLFGPTHDALVKKGLVDAETWRGKEEALLPLQTVAECDARVLWQRFAADHREVRDFYVAAGVCIEYKHDKDFHFGPPIQERDMVKQVVQGFRPASGEHPLVDVTFTPGEYLVFAVFARDVRAASKTDDHMTLEEVLACFDEPAGAHIPQDSDFQTHTVHMAERQLLVRDEQGNYRLVESLHAFARGLSSETYDAFTRYDFIDEEWLIRETTIYPAESSIYLLSSQPDGSISVQELDAAQLHEVIAQAIATLPDISDNPAKPRFAKDFFLRV